MRPDPILGRVSTHPTRTHKFKKTFNNLKITVLCGIITILVLRGTVSVGPLRGAAPGDITASAPDDIDRILLEFHSNPDPDDDDANAMLASSPLTNYTLRPKIIDWDSQRRRWLDQNSGFPNRIRGGKPQILLVTGSPPNPCDNPIGDHYLLKSTKNKIDYCRFHSIEIVHNIAHLDKELSGYWSKLSLIRRLFLSHPEVEWVWWMDSDALFTDMAFEIRLSKYGSYNLVVHGYPDLIFDQHSWIGLNTGSFLFKNCQWSLDLLDAWAMMGPKGVVWEEVGKMLTASLKGWPNFEADDQSALIYLLLYQRDRWGEKVYIENSYYVIDCQGKIKENYKVL